MNLATNATDLSVRRKDSGYAMAALFVAMAVMAVLMTVALPTWKQTLRREKEEELIFRGTQYARAIGAYQRKFANASPPSLDVLVEQHFLRKKYKDPLAPTEDGEFAPLYVNNQGLPGGGAQTGQRGGSPPVSAGSASATTTTPTGGGIVGVVSKNTGESLRTYNDKTHYNEWLFMALQQSTRADSAGGGSTGTGFSGGPGGRGPQGRGDGQGPPGGGRGRGPRGEGPGGRGPRGDGPGGQGPQGDQPRGGFPGGGIPGGGFQGRGGRD